MTAHAANVGTDAPRLRSFVGGTWAASAGDQWITDRNPSNASDVVAYVPEGVADDAWRAASAAADALGAWSSLTGVARADHLHRWSVAIADRQEELAQAVAREVGKPIGEARAPRHVGERQPDLPLVAKRAEKPFDLVDGIAVDRHGEVVAGLHRSFGC